MLSEWKTDVVGGVLCVCLVWRSFCLRWSVILTCQLLASSPGTPSQLWSQPAHAHTSYIMHDPSTLNFETSHSLEAMLRFFQGPCIIRSENSEADGCQCLTTCMHMQKYTRTWHYYYRCFLVAFTFNTCTKSEFCLTGYLRLVEQQNQWKSTCGMCEDLNSNAPPKVWASSQPTWHFL